MKIVSTTKSTIEDAPAIERLKRLQELRAEVFGVRGQQQAKDQRRHA